MSYSLEQRAAGARRACLASYLALQLLYLAKTLIWPMGGRDPNVTIWALHALPLLLFLPGMWRGDYRAFAWLAFAILAYFMKTVEGLFSPSASPYHWGALVLIVLLFTSAALYIRWHGQSQQNRQNPAEGDA